MCTKRLHEDGGWFGKSAINIPRSNTQDYQRFHMARCISGLTTNIHKHTAHACFNKEKKTIMPFQILIWKPEWYKHAIKKSIIRKEKFRGKGMEFTLHQYLCYDKVTALMHVITAVKNWRQSCHFKTYQIRMFNRGKHSREREKCMTSTGSSIHLL